MDNHKFLLCIRLRKTKSRPYPIKLIEQNNEKKREAVMPRASVWSMAEVSLSCKSQWSVWRMRSLHRCGRGIAGRLHMGSRSVSF